MHVVTFGNIFQSSHFFHIHVDFTVISYSRSTSYSLLCYTLSTNHIFYTFNKSFIFSVI